MRKNPNDFSDHVLDIINKASEAIAQGATIYFKFTCGKCGARCLSDEADKLYMYYIHTESECGYSTDINDADLGYTLVMRIF